MYTHRSNRETKRQKRLSQECGKQWVSRVPDSIEKTKQRRRLTERSGGTVNQHSIVLDGGLFNKGSRRTNLRSLTRSLWCTERTRGCGIVRTGVFQQVSPLRRLEMCGSEGRWCTGQDRGRHVWSSMSEGMELCREGEGKGEGFMRRERCHHSHSGIHRDGRMIFGPGMLSESAKESTQGPHSHISRILPIREREPPIESSQCHLFPVNVEDSGPPVVEFKCGTLPANRRQSSGSITIHSAVCKL